MGLGVRLDQTQDEIYWVVTKTKGVKEAQIVRHQIKKSITKYLLQPQYLQINTSVCICSLQTLVSTRFINQIYESQSNQKTVGMCERLYNNQLDFKYIISRLANFEWKVQKLLFDIYKVPTTTELVQFHKQKSPPLTYCYTFPIGTPCIFIKLPKYIF